MTEIKFSPESLRDLQAIRNYITNELENPIAANNTVSGILNKIKILSDFPEIGSPLSAVVQMDTNYRFLVYGNYLTFYRFENGDIFIVRILYGRRNYLDILFGK